MSNYVRACFCVEHPIDAEQIYQLLTGLDTLGCRYNIWTPGSVSGYLSATDQTIAIEEATRWAESNPDQLRQIATWLATPDQMMVVFGWRIEDESYEARIFRTDHDARIRVVFDVEESLFTRTAPLETYPPRHDETFDRFKQMLGLVIEHVAPAAGMIGYEADLLCDSYDGLDLCWGNYLTFDTLRQWPANDLPALQRLVDDYYVISGQGVLVFSHPADGPWPATPRVRQLHAVMRRNPLVATSG